MKKICLILLLIGTPLVKAQDNTLVIDDDMIQAAQAWAKDNLDDETLRSLQGADQEKVKQFLNDIQKSFQGEYVIDLAQLRDVAKVILPLMESHEETVPYAVWLKSRLDYLETAEEFRVRVQPPKTTPGTPTPPPANPKPEIEREIWIKKVADRPIPPEAKPYVSKLKPVFAKEKAPAELVWLAEVESSFDPRAKSPAGAAGMFQLMPATAKSYGLRTFPFDQRYRPEESASAAAKHLAYLKNKFKDWRLAVAAYNAGEGTVQKLLSRSKEKTYDAIASKLPAETQMYVPKVEATILKREGVKLSSLGLPRVQ